ncbi:MAG: hypothetical protein OEW88_07810 [Gammaproteobacteria bacterium]|nr:hypothetical protein [Gammaproteobacteria bacterium]
MVYRYYHRLSPWQQRVYRQSDQITVLSVPATVSLRAATLAVGRALARGEPRAISLACERFLGRVCARLSVTPPTVTVLAERPAGHWGELHGLYNPSQGPNGTITVWMRTARRSRVVAFRTFLRTLLHELCHHLDFALLGLSCSFHTTGFHRREASLYRQLLPVAGAGSVATGAAPAAR